MLGKKLPINRHASIISASVFFSLMKKAVVAGSFDLPTNGHQWMIEQGAELFDELIISVGDHPSKTPKHSVDQRIDLLEKTTRHLEHVTVATFSKLYLIDYAQSVGATHILRGIRDSNDLLYENKLRQFNEKYTKDILHTYLFPPDELSFVSSSFVRGLVGYDNWEFKVADYVPNPVYELMLLEHKGLHTTLQELSEHFNHPQGSEELWKLIFAMHLGGDRCYHNITHPTRMLAELETLPLNNKEKKLIQGAILAHDAVLKPGATNNEILSSYRINEFFPNASKQDKETMARLVIATDHTERKLTALEETIVDLDLQILGSKTPHYQEYERGIRAEYKQYDDTTYKAGRLAVLKKFYNKQPLYKTAWFRDRYEAQAKKNLREEMQRLELATTC